MPITVEEKFGRILSDSSAELGYIVRGTDSDADARAAVAGEAPSSHAGLQLEDIEVEEVGVMLWLGLARYAAPQIGGPDPGEGDGAFTFDTGGGTQHITQSLETVNTYAAPALPGAAPDFQGAIGATAESVEGVDITVPVYHFSETHFLSDSAVTNAYKGTLFYLTGRVNSAAFRGLDAGECLFLGAAGSQRAAGEDWEINFRFAGSPNVTDLSVGNITGIDKKGWEYLWIRYEDAEDAAAHMLVKRPVAAYVEKVYRDGNFADLNIGT
ncbi:MAG: hypothetical protein WD294_02360 [Phycisphaeraceae bacterium]